MMDLRLPSSVRCLAGSAPTMSSREIAELVDSRHDKVKQSIERLAGRGVIALPPMGEYLDSLGRKAAEYRIGKRDSYVVVAQLSPEFTARLVDRWQELEAAAAFQIPQTKAGALRLAAELAEQVEQQQAAIASLTPKADKYDEFINADGLIGYENAGRALGCRPRLFTNWLLEKYCFHQGGVLIPRTQFIQAGYFDVKGELGTDEVVRPRGWVTPKGLDYLAGQIPTAILINSPAQSSLKSAELPFNDTEH